jgi:hypothetical protein
MSIRLISLDGANAPEDDIRHERDCGDPSGRSGKNLRRPGRGLLDELREIAVRDEQCQKQDNNR